MSCDGIKQLGVTSSRSTLSSGLLSLTCPTSWEYDIVETPLLQQAAFELSFQQAKDEEKPREMKSSIESLSLYITPQTLAPLLQIQSLLTSSSGPSVSGLSAVPRRQRIISIPSIILPSMFKDSELHVSIKNAAMLMSTGGEGRGKRVEMIPLIEVSLDELLFQLSIPSLASRGPDSLLSSSMSLRLSIDAYNIEKAGWEPVIEPWTTRLNPKP